MQAYKACWVLSTTVKIGVATEHEFGLLMEVIEKNPAVTKVYEKALKARAMALRLTEFNKALDLEQQRDVIPSTINQHVRIDQLTSVADLIRTFRNDSGHPTGQFVSREQRFVLLHLVISCMKKIEALRNHYA